MTEWIKGELIIYWRKEIREQKEGLRCLVEMMWSWIYFPSLGEMKHIFWKYPVYSKVSNSPCRIVVLSMPGSAGYGFESQIH